MENNERQIKTTGGYFDIIAEVMIDAKTFDLGRPGKNNQNWIQNIFNPRLEAKNGQTMYMRFSSGYDSVKGKTIYARSKNETNIEIPFGDRTNQAMIDLVDEKSFIRVGYEKEEKENDKGEKYKSWVYKSFLDTFDAIAFLQQCMPLASKQRVHIKGRIKWGTYNGEVQRNYEIQSIYLLNGNEEEGKELKDKFSFTQNVLLVKDCVDYSKLHEEDRLITLNSLIMIKEKGEFKTLPVKFIMRASSDEKIKTVEKVAKKYFEVDDEVVRRINLDCVFESGYIQGNITEADLPDEAKELIEDEIYTLEEVMKMYATKERVDNLLIKRPFMKKKGEGVQVDMDDKEYLLEDLEGVEKADVEEEEKIESDESLTDLLSELDELD